MTPISHALLPLFFGKKWLQHVNTVPHVKQSALVAVCGALPDILSPHIYLDARYTSYSHTLFAVLIFSAIVLLGGKWWPLLKSVPLLCILAYTGHLAVDAICGGIAPFYPVSKMIVGGSYLKINVWLFSDAVLIGWAYAVYRWLPLRRKVRSEK